MVIGRNGLDRLAWDDIGHLAEWRRRWLRAKLGETGQRGTKTVLNLSFHLCFYTIKSINRMSFKEKPLVWVGSSKKDLCALPEEIRQFFGHAIYLAQRGMKHASAKVLKGFGGAGVLEIIDGNESGTYRGVYTVQFPDAVYVLHCFQKKSKAGIATPPADRDLIRARLKAVELSIKE